MKRIAFLTDGWLRTFAHSWAGGMLEGIRNSGEDIKLVTFSTFGNWSTDEAYNRGEYNLFRLFEPKDFDGVVLDLNNVMFRDEVDELTERIRQSGVPCVSICCEVPGSIYVGTDNTTAFSQVLEHLYEVHTARSFWFILGPEWHNENINRRKAISEFLASHELKEDEQGFYGRNFTYHCGINGFNELFGKYGKCPDAIVCANDNIAVGVLRAAERHGLSAPRDFLVTGYDDFDKARFYKPRITTVSQNRDYEGIATVNALLDLWSGQKVKEHYFSPHRLITWDSCGCFNAVRQDASEYLKDKICSELDRESFERKMLSIESRLNHCDHIKDMSQIVREYLPSFDIDGFYAVLDGRRLRASVKEGAEDTFLTSGYPERMLVYFAYERGSEETHIALREEVKPSDFYDIAGEGASVQFHPVHFYGQTIGYFVIVGPENINYRQYTFPLVNTLITGMERLFYKEKRNTLNLKLKELSLKDQMTKLYNRFGLNQLGKAKYDALKEEGKNVTIMYLDMDKLKFINDNYGHDEGDICIENIAEQIIQNMSDTGLAFRIGGDEFLIIEDEMSEAEANSMAVKIKDGLNKSASGSDSPYMVSVSVGFITTDANSNYSFENYIDRADKIMYEEKMKKKV
ncbi:MAG: diguanylate cyclase [Lachnospiraceae bacterium]|nr:diguanylate cyclase [Lachnospiraceae bacterium]